MKTGSLLAALFAGLAFVAAPALAHDNGILDKQKTPNGGQLRQAGQYHLELVVARDAGEATESPVVVYVTDHEGKKLPTAGASGTATLLAGKQKASVALKPDGDNRLKGVGRYAASPDMKVVVAVTMAGTAAEQARFTPLAAASDGHTGHRH